MSTPLSPPAETCAKARGRPRDERASRAIARAALHQLETLGYARVTMESVAAEAGVARATVYRRYRSKADLLTAAIAADCGALPSQLPARPIDELVRFLDEFDSRLAESCLEVIGGLLGAREDPRAMELHRQRVVAPRMAHARALLEAAREAGELDPGTDVDLALEMLVGAVFTRRVAGMAAGPRWAERAVALVGGRPSPGGARRRRR